MLVNQSSSMSSVMKQFYAWNGVTLGQRVKNVTLSDIALLHVPQWLGAGAVIVTITVTSETG